jgi:endo-1,4-beta-xylanase
LLSGACLSNAEAEPSLREVFASHFRIGAAITPTALQNDAQRELLFRHFNSITAENIMKPAALALIEDYYNFDTADSMIDTAAKAGIAARGHTLVWHQQSPSWFFEDDNGGAAKPEVVRKRLEKYIADVVGHFKGRIYAWDVVNEVIDPQHPDGYRRNPWFQILGPTYIETAFRAAQAADPVAKLFINDYGTEEPRKRQFLYELIKRLKANGVKIDGIGHQMHVNIHYPPVQSIDETLALFARLGLEDQITEMDVSVYTNMTQNYGKDEDIPRSELIEQAKRCRELFKVFLKHKSLTSVTFWGLSDLNTWLTSWPIHRPDQPLLFDKQLQPKPAFWAIVEPDKTIQ